MQKARGHTGLLHSAPTACRHTVSGTISLPSQGFFSPFPHGTGSLSVAREYLALRDGPRRFPRDFTCPAVLRNLSRVSETVAYGAVTLCGRSFQIVRLISWLVTRRPCGQTGPTTPSCKHDGLGYVRVRSPLLAESLLFSVPLGTEMVHFPRLPSLTLWIQLTILRYEPERVAPFGYPRVKACLRLTEAFRSLPRPSSTSGAKAFTVCP